MIWQTKKLDDVLDKVIYTKKIQQKKFLASGKFPIISQEQDLVNGYWMSEKDLFRIKTPIVIFGDHTQVLKYIDFDFVLGADGVKILQPKIFLDSKYFYYFLQSITLKNLGYARHFKLLKDISISFPESLPEQHRIVKILDDVFEKTAKAKENAEKNLQNSKELFESYLEIVFAKQGNGWKEKSLGDIILEVRTGPFGSALHKSDYVENGVPVINPQDIVNGKIIPVGKTNISESTRKRLSQYILKEKDIIFARRGEMGRCALVTKKESGWLCGTGSLLIRLKKEVDERFVLLVLQSGWIKKELEKEAIGTTMSNLNQNILNALNISIPPLLEQKSIVTRLDALSTETKKLEAIYKQKIAALDELKKSVRKKAFAGEL